MMYTSLTVSTLLLVSRVTCLSVSLPSLTASQLRGGLSSEGVLAVYWCKCQLLGYLSPLTRPDQIINCTTPHLTRPQITKSIIGIVMLGRTGGHQPGKTKKLKIFPRLAIL